MQTASGHADIQSMQTISVNTDRQGMRTMSVDRQTQYAGYISGQTWYADCQWTCRPTRQATRLRQRAGKQGVQTMPVRGQPKAKTKHLAPPVSSRMIVSDSSTSLFKG